MKTSKKRGFLESWKKKKRLKRGKNMKIEEDSLVSLIIHPKGLFVKSVRPQPISQVNFFFKSSTISTGVGSCL